MDAYRVKRNQLLAEKVIKGLQARNSEGYYAETKEEALKLALELIPKGSTIGWGGSVSVDEIGLRDAVRSGEYQVLDRDNCKDAAEKKAVERQIFGADYFFV